MLPTGDPVGLRHVTNLRGLGRSGLTGSRMFRYVTEYARRRRRPAGGAPDWPDTAIGESSGRLIIPEVFLGSAGSGHSSVPACFPKAVARSGAAGSSRGAGGRAPRGHGPWGERGPAPPP